MPLVLTKKLSLFSFLLFLGLFLAFSSVEAATSPDAIAVRVMPNTDHLSPLIWYYNNVDIKGAPQALIVDGYEAVRDGRTVYVNAGNIVKGPAASASTETMADNADTLYTNIYIISFNQEAENDTKDIFGQLLQYWKFNTELVAESGQGVCQPQSQESCNITEGCTGKFMDHSCEDDGNNNFTCVKKCTLSSDCSYGQYCDSAKAKVVRDVKRMVDLRDVRMSLDAYKIKNNKYPGLPSGSYLPNKTISVWPSWNETLGRTMGIKLPQDPVNKLQNCPSGFDSVTCWDETVKKYASTFVYPDFFPKGSLAYAYSLDVKSGVYMFCGNFETTYKGIPDDYNCLGNPVKEPDKSDIAIILGTFNSKEGAFRDYFAVNSKYEINWKTLEIIPTPSWGDWSGRGWNWTYGHTGLKVEDVKSFNNQKALVAEKVSLTNNKDYDFFDLEIKVSDIYGNTGSTKGTIKICSPTDCLAQGAECGRFPDGCGGMLLCGECASGKECVANKCITL